MIGAEVQRMEGGAFQLGGGERGSAAPRREDSAPVGWHAPVARRYTLLASIGTGAAAIVFGLLGTPGVAAQAIVMAALVGLLGLPHGAFDMEVGRAWLEPRLGKWWWTVFVGGYVALAGVAALFWVAAPSAGLALLLLIGMIHWGDDDLEAPPRGRWSRLWLGVSRGAIPVAGPCLAHPVEAQRIFEWLGAGGLTSGDIQTISAAVGVLAAPGIVVGLIGAVRLRAHEGAPAWSVALPIVEVLVIAGLIVAAPPLLAFAIYFCGWHSVRHSLRTASEIDPQNAFRAMAAYGRAVLAPTVATIVASAGVGWWLLSRDDAVSARVVAQIVFVGLFALTVPHVLLDLIPRGPLRTRRVRA